MPEETEDQELRGWRIKEGITFDEPPVKLAIVSEGGNLSGTYDPNPALVAMLNTFAVLYFTTMAELQTAADEQGVSLDEVERVFATRSGADIDALFDYARTLLNEQVQPKLEEALWELCNQLVVQSLHDLGMADGSKTDALKRMDAAFRARRNKRIGVARGGSEPRYDLSDIRSHYERLLPLWQKAKEIYKLNSKQERWPEMVKAVVGEVPSDLLARLADVPTLSDDLLTRLEKHGGGSSPSDIALEHAARECGVPDYAYTLRQLQRKAQQQVTETQTNLLSFGKR